MSDLSGFPFVTIEYGPTADPGGSVEKQGPHQIRGINVYLRENRSCYLKPAALCGAEAENPVHYFSLPGWRVIRWTESLHGLPDPTEEEAAEATAVLKKALRDLVAKTSELLATP